MGWPTKWLKNFFGAKKTSKVHRDNASSCNGETMKEGKRWSFGKPRQSSVQSMASNEVQFSSHNVDRQSMQFRRQTSTVMRSRSVKDCKYDEFWAAVAIQSAFRTYLARKALRALRALVKLQALIRGYIVRRRTAAGLQRLQALVRARAIIQQRRRRDVVAGVGRSSLHEFGHRRSFDLKSNSSETKNRSSDSFDRSPKIVEMDTCQLKQRSKSFRRASEFSPHRMLEDSNYKVSLSSPLPQKLFPSRLSIPSYTTMYEDYECWYLGTEKRRNYSKTAHSTPRLAPLTPAKSVSAVEGIRRHVSHDNSNCPNYMTNTRSSVAKVRSQSVPKARSILPETAKLYKNGLTNQNHVSEVATMLRSCNLQAHEGYILKKGLSMVGKVSRRSDLSSETERDCYLTNAW